MLRQLGRLTRRVPLAGTGAAALAVYAEPPTSDPDAISGGSGLALHEAAERGFEGVACVDDAARAAVLFSRLWQLCRRPSARQEARAYLRFLLYMQEMDGRFVNFIVDWHGRKNLAGPTSVPGGAPWQARALHGLAAAVAAFAGEPDGHLYREAFLRGLPWLDHPTDYLDVRAVGVLALMEYGTTPAGHQDGGIARQAIAWAEEIASHAGGGVLPDAPGRAHDVHLWGHLQEAALARVGATFGRPDLVSVARLSADLLLVPAVERAFAAPRTIPFDVSAAAAGLAAVAQATGEVRYATLAGQARAWFDGRNAAGAPVYDRRRGLVYDGIDDGQVSQNSGAESNVEGALALSDELPWSV